MEATYEDAARLEKGILDFLATGKASQNDARSYAACLDKLVSDRPSNGRSVSKIMAELNLPPELKALSDQGWTKADTTKISSTMRRVREILVERSTGDPGRFIKPVQVDGEDQTIRSETASTHLEQTSVDSSNWTGIKSRKERVEVIRNLMPLAKGAVESLIKELEHPKGNGTYIPV